MSRLLRRIPEGDDRERLVCPECDFVAYENPKIVVGSVIVEADRVLLCRRAIAPRAGFWTIPAGYMELGETVIEGAQREAWEEARTRIAINGLLAVYSLARLSQVQLIFHANSSEPGFEAGPETLEVRQFEWDEIPWNEIAFPSVRWALEVWHAWREGPLTSVALNPSEDWRGVLPLPGGEDG